MDNLMSWFGTWTWRYRVAIQAIIVSILSYVTALITTYVGNVSPTKDNWPVVVFGGFIVVFVMTVVSILIDKIIRVRQKDQDREHNIHRTGYVTLNREISNYIQIVREAAALPLVEKLRVPMDLMKNAVAQLYDTLETEYGAAASLEEHIEFEVTFMTKSIRDQKITIASWANRDGRAPKSLAKRDAEPDLYADTETAKLYADQNRTVRVITSTQTEEYKELYPGQKLRIRSSIIYPVVDDRFELLGTLVVHCDRGGFFRPTQIKRWRELLEPYTKRLALARIVLDKLVESHPTHQPF